MALPDEFRFRILLVEDDPLERSLAADALQDAGFAVTEAGTGEEAAAALAKLERIDVLFTDVHLPGALDGWDVAERFREVHPGRGVIYATGYSPLQPRQVWGSLFFSKPYRLAEIVKAARELIAAGGRIGPR